MKSIVRASIVLVVLALLSSAAQAQPAATLFFSGGSSAAATPAPGGEKLSLGEALFGPEARGVVYLQSGGCMVSTGCPDGSTISCTGGFQCSTTTTFCSAQGSTCPDQAVNVPSVTCDNAVRASCTCPEICFGCGASCTTNANCTSVCTCGGGRCVSGHCSCRF